MLLFRIITITCFVESEAYSQGQFMLWCVGDTCEASVDYYCSSHLPRLRLRPLPVQKHSIFAAGILIFLHMFSYFFLAQLLETAILMH